jgi:glycosyltransferase involved in cell wall biosynthesis
MISERRKKILVCKPAVSPYDVELLNKLSNHFDITVLYFQKIEEWRKWNCLDRIKYKTIFCKSKKLHILGKRVVWAVLPSDFKIDIYDEVIIETDFATILNQIRIKRLATNKDIPLKCWITIHKNYPLFLRENFLSKQLNKVANYIIDFLFLKDQSIKIFLAYGTLGAESVKEKNKRCLYPGFRFHNEETYGPISLNTVSEFNKTRFKGKKLKALMVSYLLPRKGVDFVIKLFNKYSRQTELIIVGDGERKYVNYLKSIANKNIKFVGYKESTEKSEYFKHSDLFWFHTRKDAWGLVLHEAMYFGLPCIVSKNAPSSYDLINDGINGFVYDNLSQAEEKLKFILNNREILKRISLKAKEIIDKFQAYAFKNIYEFFKS